MDPQPENNPITQSNSSPINNTTQPDRHGITIAAMAIFVLLSLAAVAFLYYQNQQLKSMLASYQATPAPTPTTTPDTTASWKIYANTDYNFSFKYPSSYTIKTSNEITGATPFIVFIYPNSKMDKLLLSFSFGKAMQNTLNNVTGMPEAANPEMPTIKLDSSSYTVTKYLYQGTEEYVANISNKMAVTINKDNETTQDETQSANQILSTFKFTEASPSATPSL